METNYYTGLTIPLCKTCNMELVSPKIFKKFRRSTTKNGIGDNVSLKGIRLNGKVYFRRICEDCYFKKRNKKLPKCNLLSYEYEHIFDISKEESKPIPFFFPDLTAKDIWEKDERKFTHIKKQGFAFACVWESQLKIENFLDLFYKNVKEYISNKLGVNNVKRS